MNELIDVSPSGGFMEMYDGINSKAINPTVLMILSITIVFYFVIFSYLGTGTQTNQMVTNNSGMNLIELIMWGLFVFLILINGLQYFFNINIKTALKSISGTPEIDIQLNSDSQDEEVVLSERPISKGLGNLIGEDSTNLLNVGGKLMVDGLEFTGKTANNLLNGKGDILTKTDDVVNDAELKIKENTNNVSNALSNVVNRNNNTDSNRQLRKRENKLPISFGSLGSSMKSGRDVFHIPNNKYSYTEAQALCKAFDSELASYEDIERAYNQGGEWCSYGWSKNKLALFPTQISTWKKMQKIKGHENDCGRPGVNGGYIENGNVRYGVNCVGKRPTISEEERIILNSVNPYPKTSEDVKIDRLVEDYKRNIKNIKIAPFNNNKWSRI